MTTLNDTERRSIAASLRVMMNTVDEFEKKTGKGGWYAETMQENCTFIAKLCGIGRYPEFRVESTAGPQQAG